MSLTGNARATGIVVVVVAALLAAVPVTHARVDAEPEAYQLFTSAQSPRQGHVFVGVTLTLLRQSAVTLRPESVRFSCTRGVIRGRGSVRYAPVTTTRVGSTKDEPGPVLAVWACWWRVPAGTAGLRLNAGYTRSAIGVDPVTGRETGRAEDGGVLPWRIRP